jgi:hypothetical protein
MFINQSTLFLSFLALRVVVAQSTPWCLLSAIGTQPDPADLGAICGADSSDVVSIIKSTCTDGDSQAALSAYSSTCSAAGQLSTSSAVSPSGTPGFVTTTPGAGPSPTPGSTGSGSGSNSGSGAYSSPGSKSGSGPVPTTAPPRPLSTGGAVSSIDAGSAAVFAGALFVGLVAML